MSNQQSKVCLASGRPALTIAVVAVVVMALFSSAPTTPVQAAEEYPSRPIDGILPVGVGGGPDRLSRFIVPRLEELLGVGMPVSNHPGAGGDKGMAQLTSRKADGYTFVTYTSLFMGKAASGLSRYNPLKELAFLPWLGISPSYLFVRSDSPWQSANELFAFARKNPETLRAAGFGVGSDEDFLVRLLADKGVVMTYVSYNKPNERYASVLGGHNEVLIEQAGDVRGFLESGQLKPVVIFTKERDKQFPDVPTAKELGMGEILYQRWMAFAVRSATSPDKIEILGDALKIAVDTPAFRKYAKEDYMNSTIYGGADEVKEIVKRDFDRVHNLARKYLKKK